MTDPWDGLPLHPERDGYHWIKTLNRDSYMALYYWFTSDDLSHWEIAGEPVYPSQMWDFEYLGPCLMPDEIQAREAAAFKAGQEDMRERAAQEVECGCDNAWQVVCHHPSSAARWNLCGRNPCGAIGAMSIRELPIKEAPHE